MDNQRLGATKNNISMSIETSLLSSEIIQEYTKEEKLMNIAERISSSPDGRLRQTKQNESPLEPKSLKSDRECKAIRVSVIKTPIKRIRNIVKDRTIETEEPSCSSEAKRNKDFESLSVKIIQNDSKINIYPNSEDNARRDYSSREHSASFSSSIIKFSDEHIITLHSSDDENASGDYTTTGPSLSSTSMFPDEQVITLDSSNEENASNDCATTPSSSSLSSMISFLDEQEETQNAFVDEIASRDSTAIESPTSVYTSESGDCLLVEESSMDLDQEFPYVCVHCGRRFSESRNLFFHSKIHGKPFICKRCNRPFYESSGFIHHIERHTKVGGIQFNCLICNYGFSRADYLRKHMMKDHGNFRSLE